MILNEHSLVVAATTKEEVKKRFSEFLCLCNELTRKRDDNVFYYTRELLVEPLYENYTVHDWLKDYTVAQKEKTFFRSLISRGNLLDDSQFLESELYININGKKEVALGCLAAYEWDSYVVSLLSSVLWANEFINGEYVNIECDECDVDIRNCSESAHIDKLIMQQRKKSRLIISSGKELWDKRKELFPHLIFCEAVRKQLEEARINLQIQAVVNRIQILEDYFSTYEGDFDKEKVGYGCRYESESVQKDERLKSMRKFATPYGKEEYFYWHISFPGNYPGRIHFLPDAEHNIGIVGYVGKHLPTKKHQTI